MKDRRNIDELFKSQLSDYKADPSPEVWERIEAQLKKKKDRKVIPLWWKVGGVAALLALLLTVGNSLYVSDTSQEIVTEDKVMADPLDTVKEQEDPIHTKRDALANEEFHQNNTSDNTEKGVIDPSPSEAQINNPQEGVVNSLEADKSRILQKNIQDPSRPIKQNRVAEIQMIPSDKSQEEERNSVIKPNEFPKDDSGIANTEKEKSKPKESIHPISEESQRIKDVEISQEMGIAKEDSEKQTDKPETTDSKKKSIFEAIEENKNEAIAKSEEKNSGAWEVTPNMGPVYYNSVNGGSSIDPSFADNSQAGEVNFSYGVQVAYAVNERFSIRSGVNNVNVGYATRGIEVASGPAAFGLQSVSYENPNRNVLTVFDKGTIPNITVDPNDPYAQLNLKSTSGNAELRQSITYFEVPLEAKYKMVNSRFGVNMIGGFSTLFLNNSEVSVNDNGFRSVLGEANNLNSVSFSTNIGLGFDYKLSKRFKLNLEPIFKYQINPYSDSSVDFNPYYFGIYSGLSFKF